jgi:hypothetical protein
MSLTWPWAPCTLLAVPLLPAFAWWSRRRRRRAAVRVTSIALVRGALPGRMRWYRRVPATLLVLGLVARAGHPGLDRRGRGRRPGRRADRRRGTGSGTGAYAADVIVVLTDGANTQGVDPQTAAKQAAERRLRVYTIGFGTTTPAPMVCVALLGPARPGTATGRSRRG